MGGDVQRRAREQHYTVGDRLTDQCCTDRARVIRARLAYANLTYAEQNSGHWPHMSEQTRKQINQYLTKQSGVAISNLESLMDQKDPGRSREALASLLAIHDKHYGFDQQNLDSYQAIVDRYG